MVLFTGYSGDRNVEGIMDDLISRKQAIDAFNPDHHVDWYTPWIVQTLEELPSVKPTHTTPSNTLGALDCVDRAEAIKAVKFYETFCDPYPRVIEALEELPSVQPRKGKWIEGRDERFVKCSECGMESTKNALMGIALFGEKEPHFCPNCGADMRGDSDN